MDAVADGEEELFESRELRTAEERQESRDVERGSVSRSHAMFFSSPPALPSTKEWFGSRGGTE